MLSARAEPKVPVIHQKLGSVLLRSNWIISHVLQNFCVHHINFIAARRASILAYTTADNHGRFLAQSFQRLPQFGINRISDHHTLHDSGSITQLRKENLAARSHVVEPTLEGYFGPSMLRKLTNKGLWWRGYFQ